MPEDTTLGWRFINPAMRAGYGVDPMPETAGNVAAEWRVSRAEQDAIALASQRKMAAAEASGRLAAEIVPVSVPQRKGEPILFADDDHPRATDPAALARLKPVVRADGTVTAGLRVGISRRWGGNARRTGGCGDPSWS